MTWYRHGDVIITQITEDEYNDLKTGNSVKSNDKRTIAYGEVTGHHHTFNKSGGSMQVLVNKDTRDSVGFKLESKTVLSHQEHKPIEIPKGYYSVAFEQEYSPLEQEFSRTLD